MSKHIRHVLFFTLILAVSCKKKTPADIGLPLLPGEDLLNAQFTDSLTLIAHTVKDDSLLMQNSSARITPSLLGNLNDPIFGITRASVFTQFEIPSGKSNPDFGTDPVLDSAVLSLVYNNKQYYGTLTSQQFDVYEVADTMSTASSYYSNQLKPIITTQKIGSAIITPNVTDSVILADGDTFPAHLRITLSKEMFQNFLDNPFYTSSYSSSAGFQKVFRGIYIVSSTTPSTGTGAVLYMNMNDIFSHITLYYKNSSDTLAHSYYFGISKDGSARFSHFEHDYSMTTDIQIQLNDTITSNPYDKIFVQPMAGVRTKITMPYLMDFFKNGKVAINKAELILPADPSTVDTIYSAHSKLVATIADPALGPVFMPDYYEGATYFGGDYDATKKEYRFNIARYVQQVLNGTRTNQGLYIIANARPTTANRVPLIGGNKTLTSRMRLNITFTPLE